MLYLWCQPSDLAEQAAAGTSHTNTHNNQKPSQESPKINNAAARAFHEIIRIGSTAADPVREGRDNVGCDDEERVVILP